MENEKQFKGTRLTLEIDDVTFSYETPYCGLDAMELLRAFYGEMIGHTFHPVSLINVMRELADEIEETLGNRDMIYKHE